MTSSVQNLPGNCRTDEQQKQAQPETQEGSPPATTVIQTMVAPPPYGHFEMGHAMQGQVVYPNINPYYGGIYGAYGGQPMIPPPLVGLQAAGLPLPTDAIEEPVYVNAKQYNAILRRRQSRAKAESENKLIKNRKPYLHESRHLHALKRARGDGGRFLNSKSDGGQENPDSKSGDEQNGVAPYDESRPSAHPASESAPLRKLHIKE